MVIHTPVLWHKQMQMRCPCPNETFISIYCPTSSTNRHRQICSYQGKLSTFRAWTAVCFHSCGSFDHDKMTWMRSISAETAMHTAKHAACGHVCLATCVSIVNPGGQSGLWRFCFSPIFISICCPTSSTNIDRHKSNGITQVEIQTQVKFYSFNLAQKQQSKKVLNYFSSSHQNPFDEGTFGDKYLLTCAAFVSKSSRPIWKIWSAHYSALEHIWSAHYSGLEHIWSAHYSGLEHIWSAHYSGLEHIWSAHYSGLEHIWSAHYSLVKHKFRTNVSKWRTFRKMCLFTKESFKIQKNLQKYRSDSNNKIKTLDSAHLN